MKEIFFFNDFEERTTNSYQRSFGLYDREIENYQYTYINIDGFSNLSFNQRSYEDREDLDRFTFLKIKRRL